MEVGASISRQLDRLFFSSTHDHIRNHMITFGLLCESDAKELVYQPQPTNNARWLLFFFSYKWSQFWSFSHCFCALTFTLLEQRTVVHPDFQFQTGQVKFVEELKGWNVVPEAVASLIAVKSVLKVNYPNLAWVIKSRFLTSRVLWYHLSSNQMFSC